MMNCLYDNCNDLSGDDYVSCAYEHCENSINVCFEIVCEPNCEGKVCGSDGCGGSCGTCGDDELCSSDQTMCISDSFLGHGPGPECNLPELYCTENCNEIAPFDPIDGYGYIDYPLNGETWENQYRSYMRKDARILIKYATAKVACKTANWDYGNKGVPLGLGDMSEQDGAIPGVSIGSPGHPENTHTNGFDIDVGYYVTDNSGNNYLKSICNHYDENNKEAYHCTDTPDILDSYRTALFLAALQEHNGLRVVGADGQAGKIINDAFYELCDRNWIEEDICLGGLSLAYEVENEGHGWYYFHHHHMHVSTNGYRPNNSLRAMMNYFMPESNIFEYGPDYQEDPYSYIK